MTEAEGTGFQTNLNERSEVADLEKSLLKKSVPEDGMERASSWCDAEARIRNTEVLQEQKKMRDPGGFRRQHLHTQATKQGIAVEDRPKVWNTELKEQKHLWMYFSQSFVQGLRHTNYTHYFGYDLDDEPGDELEENLLQRNQSDVVDKLTDMGAAIAIFKGNCGPAALTLPKAWSHGGIMVATPIYWIMALVATICVSKLLEVRVKGKSYGDMVAEAGGRVGRTAVNTSVVLLQSGACVGYFIMVSDLIRQQLFPTMSKTQLILLEAIFFIPLAWIRNVTRLWPVNLFGTVLVISALLLTLSIVVVQAAEHGKWDEVRATPEAPADFLTFLGTACYSFEGIGLVLPVYESIKNPDKFVKIYASVFVVLVGLNTTLAVTGFAAYGNGVEALVLLNLPSGFSPLYIRSAYSLAMLCTFPLQLLPAMRLVENIFFEKVKNPSMGRKMRKNLFRTLYVCFLSVVAIVGSTSLDHFISLIGAACGIPLAFVFPAMCHNALSKDLTLSQKLFNYVTFSVGVVLTVIVTYTNLSAWVSGT